MSKAKTIWDKSMSSRKKIFFDSKHDRRMRRWSERAEWYSDMPLDLYEKRRTFSSCRSCMT